MFFPVSQSGRKVPFAYLYAFIIFFSCVQVALLQLGPFGGKECLTINDQKR